MSVAPVVVLRRFLSACTLLVLAPLCGALTLPAVVARSPLAEPRFESVGDASQIPDGVVTALAQDRSGLLWIGSSAGLLRYDGYQLRSFDIRAPGAARSGTNFVRSLLAARDGSVWVGTDSAGLARFDTVAERWTFYAHNDGDAQTLSAGAVRSLAEDLDGRVWVGTLGGGLDRFDAASGRFKHFRRADGLPDERIQALLVDRQGDLWVGSWNGLARCRRAAERCEPVFGAADELAGQVVTLLGEAPDGSLWVGTRGGDLARVEPASGAARWLDRGDGTRSAYYAMAAAQDGELWLGRISGIERRRAGDGQLLDTLRRDLRRPWGLAANSVATLLRDKAGWIWVGSFGGGLQRFNANATGLEVLRLLQERGGQPVEANVRAIAQLRSGEIWLGLNEQGIAVLDRQLRSLGAIVPSAAPGGFPGGLVGAIAQDRDGQVWVGADARLYRFGAARRLLGAQAVGKGRIRLLLASSNGMLWIGTEDGLFRRDAAGMIARMALAEGRPLGGNINTLLETPDGTLWVGSEFGLFRLRPGEPGLVEVASPPGGALAASSVLGLLLDAQQRLWVDGNAGLYMAADWRAALVAFEPVAERMGFGGQAFGANLLADASGRIWSQRAVFDPATQRHYALTPADGSEIGTSWFRSYAALDDGRLLFGGSSGLLVVTPDAFKPWTYAPPLAFTELRVDGERVGRGADGQQLTLAPGQRSFSAEFAALDFSSPRSNRYRYRLEGRERDWNEAEPGYRIASYAGLAPGQYTLRVRGSNRAGVWSDHELSLVVRVLPAWWQTWWAALLALLGAAAAMAAVVQLRTRILQRRQRQLEDKVRERTEALEAVSAELRRKSQALEESSLTDPLTGLRNRRFLSRHIDADVAIAARRHLSARRQGLPPPQDGDLIFFLLDLDHFKGLNDSYGHAAGDAVLQQMRERLEPVFREGDYLLRWGGEEFLIVARATSRLHASELAQRARAAVGGKPFDLGDGRSVTLTCSLGFAAYPLQPEQPALLDWQVSLGLADAALYAAKRAGRNTWVGVPGTPLRDTAALQAQAARPQSEWLASGALDVLKAA